MGDDDSAALHLADTLAAGDGLCDPAIAAASSPRRPAAIAALERARRSLRPDMPPANSSLGLEAAHNRRRIVHAEGDGSGAAIMRALIEAVMHNAAISVLEGFEARRILMDGEQVAGLLCATANGAAILPTSRVVLATGGIGGLYDATTNPIGNFGQGIALAARAGAALADMEFVQFHPTALDWRRRPLALISEAVRGEGALLVNETRRRFMARHARRRTCAARRRGAGDLAEIARGASRLPRCPRSSRQPLCRALSCHLRAFAARPASIRRKTSFPSARPLTITWAALPRMQTGRSFGSRTLGLR